MDKEFRYACFINNLERAKDIYYNYKFRIIYNRSCVIANDPQHVNHKREVASAKTKNYYELYNWLVSIPKEIYVIEFIAKLDNLPFYYNPMFDMNVFTNVIWSYLFDKNTMKNILKEIYVIEFISKLNKFPFSKNPIFDINVFTHIVWSYLFDKN